MANERIDLAPADARRLRAADIDVRRCMDRAERAALQHKVEIADAVTAGRALVATLVEAHGGDPTVEWALDGDALVRR